MNTRFKGVRTTGADLKKTFVVLPRFELLRVENTEALLDTYCELYSFPRQDSYSSFDCQPWYKKAQVKYGKFKTVLYYLHGSH